MRGGGYPDKIGNRYEKRWVLYQLIALVSNRHAIHSLEWEPVGADARGVDLWVNYRDGTRHGYQCKLKNGKKGTWSIADLARSGILGDLRFQVERDPKRYRFSLVSGAPSPDLEDLCREASDSRDAKTFLEAQIEPVGRLRSLFASFCQALDLRTTVESSVDLAWNLLQGSSFYLFHYNDQQQRDMVERLASCVSGEPRLALSALATFAEERLRRQVDIDAVEKYLDTCGVKLLRGTTDRVRHYLAELHSERREKGQLLKLSNELEEAGLAVKRDFQSGVTLQKLEERWTLMRPLGEGLFGRVWLAFDSYLQQEVAVKILRDDLVENPSARHLFYRGGRLIADLDRRGTGIVHVLEPPQCWEGYHFYIMEHFGGKKLSELLVGPVSSDYRPASAGEETGFGEPKALDPKFIWKVVRSVGEALGSLHQNNLFHCDVTPWNILVASDGEVKIADFDLLRGKDDANVNEKAEFFSVPYTAPEMLDGCGELLPAIDIYSLALVAIYLLHGKELPTGQCTSHLDSFIENLSCPRSTKSVLKRATKAARRYSDMPSFLNSLSPGAFARSHATLDGIA